ncbi:Tad domain-containing protein [Xanthobacter sp. V13C-7B]|uniref:TadE/TadG family type IV pilus assembly protein n=1 Tax=Xanthobacter variabilis TaxID=3119932 RepID=UPI0037272813
MRKTISRATRRLRSDRGNIIVLAGLFSLGLLSAGGVAIDFARASGLQRKIQAANELGAREGARGKTDAEVVALVRGQLDSYLNSRGYTTGGAGVTVKVGRSAGVVSVVSSTTYKSLFGSLYNGANKTISVATTSSARALCTAPDPQTRWVDSSASCPAGYLGTITYQRAQQRTAACASETAASATWSAWSNTGAERNRVDTCEPKCVVPADQYQWGANRTEACPAGYKGVITVQDRQVRSGYCPAATGPSAWNTWTDTGTTREVSNTCTPICTPAAAQTQWVDRSASCPAGYTGSNSWEAQQTRTSYCSGTTLKWNAWTDTGSTRNTSNSCTPPSGEKEFLTPGTYTWTVPEGVTQISAVAVAGGASAPLHKTVEKYSGAAAEFVSKAFTVAYCEDDPWDDVPEVCYPSVPVGAARDYANFALSNTGDGEAGQPSSLVGTGVNLLANGGGYDGDLTHGGCGGVKQGGGCGGDGLPGAAIGPWRYANSSGIGNSSETITAIIAPTGGGGAGGYAGNGGASGKPGAGGGGAGGTAITSTYLAGGGGGGVGLLGKGASGSTAGSAGSAGADGIGGVYSAFRSGQQISIQEIQGAGVTAGSGGNYGGGGGAVATGLTGGDPAYQYATYARIDLSNGMNIGPWLKASDYFRDLYIGHGGGGGELSYGTYAVTPGTKITVKVGRGGASKLHPFVCNIFNCSKRLNYTERSWPVNTGAGGNGAVRIIWGPGRSYPSSAK